MSMADRLSTLPPRVQRTLALLVVPAALTTIWACVVWPLLHAWQGQVEWRQSVVQTLARQRGLARIESSLRTQLTTLPGLASWRRLYRMSAEGASVIALQSDVSNALVAAHARPQSFAPIAPTRTGPLTKAGLRVTASMTIDQLHEFLQQIEGLGHFVRIEHLTIVAPPIQPPRENPPLNVMLEAFGFATESAAVTAATTAQSEHR